MTYKNRKKLKKLNIVCIVDDDKTWTLHTWINTVPHLKKNGYAIKKMIIVPPKLSKLKGFKIYKWYFDKFGIFNFFKLGLFYFSRIIYIYKKHFFNKNFPKNFADLGKKYCIGIKKMNDLKGKGFLKEIGEKKIDIIIIMTSHIIPKNIISIPEIGIINKHASALPSNKGLFPFLWAAIKNEKQAITFHTVNEKIDGGRLLFQEDLSELRFSSMINFYEYVFSRYPQDLLLAIRNLLHKNFFEKKYIESYQGLPNKKDLKIFFRKGFAIITLKDIISQFKNDK